IKIRNLSGNCNWPEQVFDFSPHASPAFQGSPARLLRPPLLLPGTNCRSPPAQPLPDPHKQQGDKEKCQDRFRTIQQDMRISQLAHVAEGIGIKSGKSPPELDESNI